MDPCLGDLILVLKLPSWFKKLLSFLLKPLVRAPGMQGHGPRDTAPGTRSPGPHLMLPLALPPLVSRSGQAWSPFYSLTNLFVKRGMTWTWEVGGRGGGGRGHQSLTLCLFWCSFLGWQPFSAVCVLGENFSCTLTPAPVFPQLA